MPTDGGVGADEDPGGVDEPGAEAEPLGGVVVAAGDDDLRPRRGQPRERLVGQPDRVDLGQRPVVDVAGDHDEVDPLRLDHLEQVVDVRRLVAEHPLTVERPPEVPVGGVEDAHGTNLGRGADTRCGPTPNAVEVPAGPGAVSPGAGTTQLAVTGAPSQHGRMWPHRSQREWEVSQRIRAPQLSQSMSSIGPDPAKPAAGSRDEARGRQE